MKFGMRECANIVFRAKQETKIGTQTFHTGQPVLMIDTAKTSTLEQASTTVYAQGGAGNSRLMAWEGEKTLTFTVEDALLSPIGFSILSGAGLFKAGDGTNSTEETGGTDESSSGGYNYKDLVHYHLNSMASGDSNGKIDMTDALAQFGTKADGKTLRATINATDAPLYIIGIEDDGSVTGKVYTGATVATDGLSITVADAKNTNVMVDCYVNLPGEQVWEADITADTFAGYYYVEADTLFRRQSDGVDMPANITLPNVKLQSNFSIAMAGTGDPSTFTFTMDAFPGYTYFDKSKKVLCVMQIVDDAVNTASMGNPVMPHNNIIEHSDISADDSIAEASGE